MNVEQISAVTLKVGDMARSLHFYKDTLRLDILYGGKNAYFSSLRPSGARAVILNLEQGSAVTGWGRLIFYVKDVDELWVYLREKGFSPERPSDAEWGERYFHLLDPDGNDLSFAQPLT